MDPEDPQEPQEALHTNLRYLEFADYQILEVICQDESSEGLIYFVNKGQQYYAAKVYYSSGPMIRELEFLTRVNSPFVIRHIDHFAGVEIRNRQREQMERRDILVLEYARGDALDFLNMGRPFSQQVCKRLFQSLMLGLRDIHEEGAAHLDLKCENLLVDRDYQLKIADFGFAKLLGPGERVRKGEIGSKFYAAPETKKADFHGPAADIFFAGVILFIFMFKNVDEISRIQKSHKFNPHWKKYENYLGCEISESCRLLFQSIFEEKPEERASIPTILANQWLLSDPASPETVGKELKKRWGKMVEKNKGNRQKIEKLIQAMSQGKEGEEGGNFRSSCSQTKLFIDSSSGELEKMPIKKEGVMNRVTRISPIQLSLIVREAIQDSEKMRQILRPYNREVEDLKLTVYDGMMDMLFTLREEEQLGQNLESEEVLLQIQFSKQSESDPYFAYRIIKNRGNTLLLEVLRRAIQQEVAGIK